MKEKTLFGLAKEVIYFDGIPGYVTERRLFEELQPLINKLRETGRSVTGGRGKLGMVGLPKDAEVIERYFGIYGPPTTLAAIARGWGISRSRVAQYRHRGLCVLRTLYARKQKARAKDEICADIIYEWGEKKKEGRYVVKYKHKNHLGYDVYLGEDFKPTVERRKAKILTDISQGGSKISIPMFISDAHSYAEREDL